MSATRTGVKLIRLAQPGFPAKYCTGVSHYLLSKDGSWQMCDQYIKFDHAACNDITNA